MKRLSWTLLALLVGGPVLAACPAGSTCQTFAAFTAGVASASALAGTELFPCIQSAATVSCTPAQLKTYVGNPAFSAIGAGTNANALVIGTGGSLTISGSGTINATTLGSATFAAPGPIGSGTPSTGAFTTLAASSTVSGAGFSTYLASPPAIGGSAAAAGKFTTLQDTGNLTTNVTGSTQCLHVDTTGLVSGTGSDCGSGGSTAFSALTGSTNTTAAMLVGTGASLGVTGAGTINSTTLGGATFAAPGAIGGGTPAAGTFTTLVGTTINGNTFTTGTATLTGAASKTLTFSNTLTLAGTDGTTMTFPATSQTVAGLGTAETWSALQTFGTNISIGGVSATGATGTGNVAFSSSPTFVTPALGAATATSINGNTFTTGTYTLTGVAGKTLTFDKTLEFDGTDSTKMTFPATSDTVVTLGATQTLTAKTLTTPTASALTLSDVATGTQCLHANGSGVVSGTGADCTSGTRKQVIQWTLGTTAQNTTIYLGGSQSSSTVDNVDVIFPAAGTLKNLYVRSVSNPAAGQTFTYTVCGGTLGSTSCAAGSPGAITCQVASSASPVGQCNDVTNSLAITAGQGMQIKIVTSATSGSTGIASFALEFDPT